MLWKGQTAREKRNFGEVLRDEGEGMEGEQGKLSSCG